VERESRSTGEKWGEPLAVLRGETKGTGGGPPDTFYRRGAGVWLREADRDPTEGSSPKKIDWA